MNRKRRIARNAVAIGLALAVACALWPVHNRILQAGFFLGTAMLWLGLLGILKGHRLLRVSVALLPLLPVIPFILPGGPVDPEKLRADYVRRMGDFDGTSYVWGGESPLGIDCSGLPRRALRDALWSEGCRHLNGAAFRQWFEQWFHDSSARAMAAGYRGRTRAVGLTGPLWSLDPARLLPGDLAVREDGVHVVAYLGCNEWIEADPTRGRVHRWISTPGDGVWYEPMAVYRWVITEPVGPPSR